jgi:hypothetical protein
MPDEAEDDPDEKAHHRTASCPAAASRPATATATPAPALLTETGCPSAFQVLSVAELTAQGYRGPAIVDDPANGGNGRVCGLPLPQQACGPDCPVPAFYQFGDDHLRARN